ncbi:MAG: four-carbon acid sugar kinase family protein [Actinomycetaceae bacterium]|nr:four-carbon acid sugar kinase family protein [Actinomycetaceae bacterium]
MESKTLDALLEGYPASVAINASAVREKATGSPVFVVLDDDPTGTQSVSDLPVLTSWEDSDFAWAFETGKPAVYVMTNSRSLAPDQAKAVNEEVVDAALRVAADVGLKVAFVSRSDSTLRGHFPLEPDTIAARIEATGTVVDGVVIVPAFGDAGRITVDSIHYAGSLATGFVPVAQTEFAKDATFGYSHSDIPGWVEEKTQGKTKAEDVITIPLDLLRTDQEAVVALLRKASKRQAIAPDIVTEEDLRLLSLALIEAENQGSTFIYRVGPPFVRARIGQDEHAPLSVEEVQTSRGIAGDTAKGGLIVVGSHVGLTTRQLDQLRARRHPVELEIDVAKVLDPALREGHLAEISETAIKGLDTENIVIRTSRLLVTGTSGDESLEISRQVSAAVVSVVQSILKQVKPRFVIAKGGITSSDVASKGLSIRHAIVVGPMLPGIVSLWSPQDGPAQGIPYIVFAGNVGNDESLADVADKLSA